MNTFMRTFLRRLLLLLLLALAGGIGLAYDAYVQLNTPLPIAEVTRVELPPGVRLRAALSELSDRGVFANRRQALYLEAYARYGQLASGIKAGEYDIAIGTTPLGVLALWLSGKTVMYEWRLVEGMRFDQALGLLAAHPAVRHTLAGSDAAAAMAAIGRPGVHPEGRLFPDTYLFQRGSTDVELLKQAARAMDEVLAEEWATRVVDLPLNSPEQALVLASIVEKETGLASERAQIAGVFVRRLRIGMRLQTDPTVIYGMGAAYDGNIRRNDLSADTPYNTYTRDGLPPTPICLPGRAAIHAALHPEDGDSLYFVARGDGSGAHVFSATLAQHEANVDRYQRRRQR